MLKKPVFHRLAQGLLLTYGLCLATSDTDPQKEKYSARVSNLDLGGVGGGSGGLSGISALLSTGNSGAMVNEFTGQPAFPVALGAISAQNGLSYSLSMSYYGGGVEALAKANPQYEPGGWVGAGFSLKPPFLQVSGANLSFEAQKYSLSLDGMSQQELIQIGTGDDFVLKENPYIRIHRFGGTQISRLKDRCPNQVDQIFSFTTPAIAYWTVDFPDGTQYMFGDSTADCDSAESELCQPLVGSEFKYAPFYSLERNGKAATTYYLSSLRDRQRQSAIWFRYDKVQDTVWGSCNFLNSTPTFPTVLDRALYLKEIYATAGTGREDEQTSKIAFATAPKTEEPVFPPLKSYPTAFYENRKLTGIQFYEKGNIIRSLQLNYTSLLGRLALASIQAQDPVLYSTRDVLALDYVPGTLRLNRIRDSQDRLVEYRYGTVEATPINGSNFSADHQILEPNALSSNTRIALAQQVGNKFYLETENWSAGCNDGGAIPDTFREHLYEYEFDGTYWALKRVTDAPYNDCPTAMDAFLSPNGKYFIWTAAFDGFARIFLYDITSDDPSLTPITFDYNHVKDHSRWTEVYPYSDWFAVYNPDFKNDLSFYHKNSTGAWTSACPSDIAPSTYDPPTPLYPRSNNYSGENEGVVPGSCLTFGSPLRVIPGPNFLIAINDEKDIFHVFADNGGLHDYVKGLESTTPPLDNFTFSQVGDGDLVNKPRPWFRHAIVQGTNTFRYDNNYDNSGNHIAKVAVSENLIAVEYGTGKDYWKYLYVFGWDGNQLRYLYDEPLHADQDDPDEVELAAGPDYFLVKNLYSGAGARQGFFYYKVDLKAWKVVPPTPGAWPPATKLDVGPIGAVDGDDFVMKTYPDLLFFEKMENDKGSVAFSPTLVTTGGNSGSSDIGGVFYPTKDQSTVFMLDADRTPVDISSEFTGLAAGFDATNFSMQGDRVLGVKTISPSSGNYLTTKYLTWKRNADPAGIPHWILDSIPVPDPLTDQYHSCRMVNGGVMMTRFHKNQNVESLGEIDFYPDVFDKVPKPDDPSEFVQGAYVVDSVLVKTKGDVSTGNHLQTLALSYPDTSPDGIQDGAILKNYQTGTPNFRYVRKDLAQGAQVTRYLRDELLNKVPKEERARIGTVVNTWSLPDKVSYRKPGGATDSSWSILADVPGMPDDVRVVQPVQDSSRTFFFNAYRTALVNRADFDSKNGRPKIMVSKAGDKYSVTLEQYQQDLDNTFIGPFNLLRQRSTFQFDTDPCVRVAGGYPCGNLKTSWFTPDQMPHILSSSILTYDAQNRLQNVYQWRPDALGTVYPPLNGDPTSTGAGWKWEKVRTQTRWQDQPVARCKSDLGTESQSFGVFTTTFLGGSDCEVLGVVSNSPLSTAALLTGEEDILSETCSAGAGTCLGAFGRWEVGGNATLQSQVVHTGRYALQVTGIYGPTINLKLREAAGFMDRGKGFLVSAWVLATEASNPAFGIEIRPGGGGDPVAFINPIQEYSTAHGSFPVGRWVKVERLISHAELTANGRFASTPSSDYLRIWIGKGDSTSTTHPVYVDDVRLYPADATVSTRNVDGTGLVTSTLDAENEPSFFEYDVWRAPVGARRKDGMVTTSAAFKRLNE